MGDKRGFTSVVYYTSLDPERTFPGATVEVEKLFITLTEEEQAEFGKLLAELSVLGGLFQDPVILLRGISRAAVWWQTGEGGGHAISDEEVVVKQFRSRLEELHRLTT